MTASYYPDPNHDGQIDDSVDPTLVRSEPQVNVDWKAGTRWHPR